MGRRSQAKKKQKRKLQKYKKQQQKRLQTTLKVITSDSRPNLSPSPNPGVNDESMSSFGSPGSPPPTPDSELTLSSSNELDETLGIDSDALTAELNTRYNFEKPELGEKLEGQELVSHLKESNMKLAAKVRHYRNQSERAKAELQSCKMAHNDSVDRIRYFYRDLIYYGTSYGAKMLKASYETSH